MVAPASETVEYRILLQAAEAIRQLQQMSAHASNFNQKIVMATEVTRNFGQKTGLSMKNSVSILKEMDQVMAEANNTQQVFGNLGKEGWNSVASAAEQGSRRTLRSIDAIRIALGVLVSMLIFQVMQAFSNAFRSAIENLRETELAVYNLINAERKLSRLGIEITPQELQDIIDKVQELVPILSRIEAQELVSRIASNVAPSIGLTTKEVEKLSKAVGLAYIQNKALGYSFDEVEKSFTESILTGKVSQGINKYGVKIDDLIIKQHAVKMGLVESEEAFDRLSGEMQAHVKAVALIDYAYQEFSKNAESIPEFMQTTDATIESTGKAWDDFTTILGQTFSPIIIETLKGITEQLSQMRRETSAAGDVFKRLIAILAGLQAGSIELTKPFKDAEGNLVSFKQRYQDVVQAMYDAIQAAKKGTADLTGADDTPTGVPELPDPPSVKEWEEFGNKIEDIKEDYENSLRDLELKRDQKSEDLDLEYLRKAEDALTDYHRKIEDINNDAEQRKADALRKSREKDLEAERDYQNKLWELRMRFLMDLEDALHARDARQIIRLQKQYAIDKESLLRKKKLDDQSRQDDLQAELEQIERQRQQKLEDAKRDYEQKLADQRKAKQRELEDLNVWYAREQADLRQHLQRKMQDLINAWIQEGKITQAGAAQVYAILFSYFGPGGLTDQLYQYMQSQLAGMVSPTSLNASMGLGMVNPFAGGVSQNASLNLNQGVGNDANLFTNTPISNYGFAEGGTLIATRPMTATFGEVPEAVTFTPLDKPGNNVGRLFGDKSGIGGGMLEVLLTLSPDLEHRIIQKSLDGAADVIVKVNRSRV